MVSLHKVRKRAKEAKSINLDNVITVEWLGDRTSISFVNGGMETLETAPDEVIQPHQVQRALAAYIGLPCSQAAENRLELAGGTTHDCLHSPEW